MSEHPPYDPDRPCPKCGNPIISTEHRRGHHGVIVGWLGLGQEFGDRMVRKCGRCTHSWYELPADHDEEAEIAALTAWATEVGARES